MRTFTEEQIRDAFLQWEHEIREEPDVFVGDDDRMEYTPEEVAEWSADALIRCIDGGTAQNIEEEDTP